MKLILEIIPHVGEDFVFYRKFDTFPIKIGRGMDNDVILADPHIDSEHVVIDIIKAQDNEIINIKDNATTNGTSINGNSITSSGINIGDVISIGVSEIRVLSPDFKVPETIKIEKRNAILDWLDKPYSAWICVLVTFFAMQLWSYLEVWTYEHGVLAAATAAGTVLSIMVWALIWSVASRMIRNKTNFKAHASIASLYLLISVIVWFIQSYVRALTNENIVSEIINYSFGFVSFAALIYASLSFTSRMMDRKNLNFSAIFALSVVLGMAAFGYINNDKFDVRPRYSGSIEPYISALVATDSLDEFMSDNSAMFAAKTFNEQKEKQ